ncbi:MAG: LysE family translocator [Hyphomicrobiaceae bacterium]|nr:LysE family translocator [Hyphomicrobiaceae bacterium]
MLPNPLVIPIGFIIGIIVAAPVGPVNVLCIQRAISRGFWGGLAAGLGAMLGDGLIALAAALGVGAITTAVTTYRGVIQTIGGIALIAFGMHLYLSPPPTAAVDDGNGGAGGAAGSLVDYASDIPKTFFLTVTNPGAVLGLFAIFGGVSTYVEVKGRADALTMVAAVMAGSLAWWLSLSAIVSRVRHKLKPEWLRTINTYAGLLLIGFGLLLVGELLIKR